MTKSSIDSLKIKAKLLQKAKTKAGIDFPLKDAYQLIASNAGYSSWKDMKDSYHIADVLNPPKWSAMWKVWFSSKEEALQSMDDKVNYLLPYRNHFFICDIDYLNALGIPENDDDLLKVGRDWSMPRDKDAWLRLIQKIRHS